MDAIDYFAGDNKIMSRPKSAAVIDIDIANILRQKYRCRIDIGKCDIDPPLRRIFMKFCVYIFMWL